jgi:hypothetical protein
MNLETIKYPKFHTFTSDINTHESNIDPIVKIFNIIVKKCVAYSQEDILFIKLITSLE